MYLLLLLFDTIHTPWIVVGDLRMGKVASNDPSLVTVGLSETKVDARLAQRVVQLTVKNDTNLKIQISRIDETLDSREVRTSRSNALFEVESRRERVIKDLEDILNDEILFSNNKNVEQRAKLLVGHMNDILKSDFDNFWGFLKYCATYFYRPLIARIIIERLRDRLRANNVTIHGYNHACETVEDFKTRYQVSATRDFVIKSKLAVLGKLEQQIEDQSSAMIFVGPSEEYNETFVFTFPSFRASRQTYGVLFDVYLKGPRPFGQLRKRISHSIDAPPSQMLLGTISCLVAFVVSASAKFSSAGKLAASRAEPTLFGHLSSSIIAMVLAFAIFSAYEYLWFGKKLPLPFNWQAAVLIGFICGIFSDNIIHTLGGLIGIK